MEFDDLKSNWKKAGAGIKDQDELLMMTKIKNHPHIKRIKIKFLIEAILLITFLVLYYDGFDGATKPLWANILLIASTFTYIIVRFMGWLALRNPVKGDNLKKSLLRFSHQLKQIAFSVLVSSLLFGSAIIAFFTSSIDFTKEKYFLLAGMIITLLCLVYLSLRNWLQRIEKIKVTLKEFKDGTT